MAKYIKDQAICSPKIFTRLKKKKKNLAAEKSGGTTDRVTADQRYNGARCTEAWLYYSRLKIVESIKLILAPRLHSVSNRTTHFRVNSGGYFWWVRRNKHRFYDFIRGIFTWVDRSYIFLRAMCSTRVILSLEQQVDVLEELVRDNRVEVNFTLATNGMDNGASNDSQTDIAVDSIVHWHWQWHCINQAAIANDHHASCSTSSSTSWMLTHLYARTCTHISTYTHYINTLLVNKVFRI